MDQHLYKFLVLYKHLCIPQLGSFTVERSSARFDEQSGILHPPAEAIVFSDGVLPVSEKLFFDFLAAETGEDEATAIRRFHDFCFNFRSQLTETGTVSIKGIGSLSRKGSLPPVFEAVPRLNDLFPVLSPAAVAADNSPEVVVTEEEEIEEKKDNWWIYAVVLFLLGAGALLIYYFR